VTRIRSIDLSQLIDQFKDFTKVLGPEEIKILTDADLLLSGTIHHDEASKLAYLSKSSQIQSRLNNLLSRLTYIRSMSVLDRDAYWGGLLEAEEYEGRDKRYIALARDSKLRDLEETNAALEVVRDHVNNLTWILKTISSRV
jgi:hypothetical protein